MGSSSKRQTTMAKMARERRLQEKRERTPASGKLFAQRHTPGGRRFHGFTQAQICTIIGGDYYDELR